MSRRRNTPEQEIPNVSATPANALHPVPAKTDQPASHQADQKNQAPEKEEITLPVGQFFVARADLDAAIAAYKLKPGNCPNCGCKITRGISGHISKCLRLSKYKTESTMTS